MNKNVYLYLTIIFTVLAYIPMSLFVLEGKYDLNYIIEIITSNYLIIFLLADLLFSCVIFWIFMYQEVKKYNIEYWWIALASNFLVGLCTAIPLFLYFRSRSIELNNQKTA